VKRLGYDGWLFGRNVKTLQHFFIIRNNHVSSLFSPLFPLSSLSLFSFFYLLMMLTNLGRKKIIDTNMPKKK